MNDHTTARGYSRSLPLITWTAAMGFVLAGLSPALSDNLELHETVICSADGAIETVAKWGSADGAVFHATAIDLNGDTEPEWAVQVEHMYQCRGKPRKCRTWVMHRQPDGTWEGTTHPYAREVNVSVSLTNGFRDLEVDGVFCSFDGSECREGRSPTADIPATPQPPVMVQSPAPATPESHSDSKPADGVIAVTEPPSDWQSFRFRDYSAQAPAKWQKTEDTDNAITYFSGDAESGVGAVFGVALVPEDGILPPHAAINAEREVTLAGQPFLWRELTFDDGGTGSDSEIILLTSPHPVEDDRYLLIFAGSFGVPMAQHRAEIDGILGSIRLSQPAPAVLSPPAADDARPIPPSSGAPGPQPVVPATAIDVEGVSFILPDGWIAKYDSPGDKLFRSPDGRWTLLSFWWFPDEPLLGYDDITKVEYMVIDHEPVTRIHVTRGNRLSIQNVTERARGDEKRFIFTIEGEGVSAAEMQAMHDRLVASLHLQGGFDPSLQADQATAVPLPGPAPATAQPPVADMSAGAIPGLEILEVPAAPPPDLEIFAAPPLPPQVSWTTYVNARFGVQVDYPAELFAPTPPPENGDGQAFVALDGGSRFSVWGSNNVLAATVQTAMDDFSNTLVPGSIRSSRETGAGGFETVALRDGKLAFHSEIVNAEVLFGFEAELDDPSDTAMADILGAMMESLRPPE